MAIENYYYIFVSCSWQNPSVFTGAVNKVPKNGGILPKFRRNIPLFLGLQKTIFIRVNGNVAKI